MNSMTGNLLTDVAVLVIAAMGLALLFAQEWLNYKDKRRWRKK